jgi:CheY-like chemotaxis protein
MPRVVIIDNDEDDHQFLISALQNSGVKYVIECFHSRADVLRYLPTNTEKFFLIISDVNMALMNGFELRKQINGNAYLSAKGIPFIFLSTSAVPDQVQQGNALNVQGFFQ